MSLSIGLSVGIDRSFSGQAGGGLTAPSLTNSSALGASPLVLQWSDADDVQGLYGQLQIATDSSFASITQNIGFFIDASNIATLSESIGLATPSGLYYARIRVCRDNDNGTSITFNEWNGAAFNSVTFNADVSPWSNVFSDTISSSAAIWTTTNGTKKSAQLILSNANLTLQGTLGWGAYQSVAASISGASKSQWEITLNTLATDSNRVIAFGRYNGTTDFTTTNEPGVNDANGYAIQITPGSTSCQVFDANATQIGNFTLSSAAAANDVFSDELDVSGAAGTHSITIYRNNVLVGTITGKTLTGFTTAFAAIKSNEKLTANFGGQAWTHTPDTGYVLYG